MLKVEKETLLQESHKWKIVKNKKCATKLLRKMIKLSKYVYQM